MMKTKNIAKHFEKNEFTPLKYEQSFAVAS